MEDGACQTEKNGIFTVSSPRSVSFIRKFSSMTLNRGKQHHQHPKIGYPRKYKFRSSSQCVWPPTSSLYTLPAHTIAPNRVDTIYCVCRQISTFYESEMKETRENEIGKESNFHSQPLQVAQNKAGRGHKVRQTRV